ncbi:hypothetical protein [Nonomuraea sp. NPDC049480]|uniref:hypothetical protein n=1 Tax=Nonomuraea sp. NPDC049480 TaxID=3364353 RepID=UPI0037A41AAC
MTRELANILSLGAANLAAMALMFAFLWSRIRYLTRALVEAHADRDAANKRAAELLQQRINDTHTATDRLNTMVNRLRDNNATADTSLDGDAA